MSLEQGCPPNFPPNADSLERRLKKVVRKREKRARHLQDNGDSLKSLDSIPANQLPGQADSAREHLHDEDQKCSDSAQSIDESKSYESDIQKLVIFSSSSDSEDQVLGRDRPANIRDFQAGRLPFQKEARKEQQRVYRITQKRWKQHGAESRADDVEKRDKKYITADSDIQKLLSNNQDLGKDKTDLSEGDLSGVQDHGNPVQGFAVPRSNCVLCRRKHKSGCVELYCSDCSHAMELNDAEPLKAMSQRDYTNASFQSKRNPFAEFLKDSSGDERDSSPDKTHVLSDTFDKSENKSTQRLRKRKTRTPKNSKKEQNNISISHCSDFGSRSLGHDDIGVCFKFRKINNTWKVEISFNDENAHRYSNVAKAEQSFSKDLKRDLYSATANANMMRSVSSHYLITTAFLLLFCFILGLLVGTRTTGLPYVFGSD